MGESNEPMSFTGEQQSSGGGSGGGSDVAAVASALDSLFGLVVEVLKPITLSAQAFFTQLVNAQPKFFDPYADTYDRRQKTNQILIYSGVGIVVLLLIAVVLKNRQNSN